MLCSFSLLYNITNWILGVVDYIFNILSTNELKPHILFIWWQILKLDEIVFFLFLSWCFLSSPRSSDADSVTETKKKKRKRKQWDSEPEQHSSGAAHRSRGSEERESPKQRCHDLKDPQHDQGFSPEKRQRTDYDDDRSDHLPPSNHTSPSNGSAHHHLNGYTGITSFSHAKSSSTTHRHHHHQMLQWWLL